MPDYRIYQLVGGAHIQAPATVVRCGTDAEAIAHARQLLDGHDIEVWDGGRLVINLESKDKKTHRSVTDQ